MDVLEDALKNNISMCVRTVPNVDFNENSFSTNLPSNLSRPLSCKSSKLMNGTPYGWYPTAKGQQFKTPDYKTFTSYDEELSFLQQHGLSNATSVRQKLKANSHMNTTTVNRSDSRSCTTLLSIKPAIESSIQADDHDRLTTRPQANQLPIHCCPSDGCNFKNEWKPKYPSPTWSEDVERNSYSSNEEFKKPSVTSHGVITASEKKSRLPSQRQRPQTVPATFKGMRMTHNQSVDQIRDGGGAAGGRLIIEGNKLTSNKRRPATAQLKCAKSVISSSMQKALQATELANNGSTSNQQENREIEKENTNTKDLNSTSCLEENRGVNVIEDDYDKALKHYGWRMEIPNDPLNLKQAYLAKRLSYTVQVPEPTILKQPPCMIRTNVETFFQHTVPNQKLSFDISPDFVSERYSRARSALQKKGLWNYAYKNFSFIY